MINKDHKKCSKCGKYFNAIEREISKEFDVGFGSFCVSCLLSIYLDSDAFLLQWVADLQSGMYVNCVYCGHNFGPTENTPSSMADMLKEHIMECEKHPMSELKKEYDALQKKYDELLEKHNKLIAG